MEDNKVWINLGSDLIDQASFLTNSANNINGYVEGLPWSNKRKQSFLNAYSAIMNSGVTGADSSTGKWELQTQTPVDESSLSDMDKEMLKDAAYYILSQMKTVSPKGSVELNKPKTKFVASTAFDNWVSNNVFGGTEFSRTDDWNVLDERDINTGRRGVSNRMSKMINYLEGFRDTINDNDWDFSENPVIHNSEEAKAKINEAISALSGKTEIDQDVIDTLNTLGIKHRVWFDNGLGEDSGYTLNGTPLTWGQYIEAKKLLEKKELKDKQEKLRLENLALMSSPWSTYGIMTFNKSIKGWSDKDIADKIGGDSQSIVAKVNELSLKMGNLSPDEKSMLYGIFRSSNIPKLLISQETYNILRRTGRYNGQPIARFSQIPGVDGIVMDNVTGQLLYPKNGINSNTSGAWIKGSKDLENEYLNSSKDGLTSAEWQELASIGLDIASIIDVEPWTAAGMGIAAADLRRRAIDQTPGHKWTFWEGVGQGLDYISGAIAALPGLGDGVTFVKLLNKIEKPLRMIGRLGAWKDLYDSIPGLEAAYNKWQNGKDLTVGDWRAIAQGIRGLVSHGLLNRVHRAERKVMQESGVLLKLEKTPEFLRKIGLFKTEAANSSTIPTLRINVDGKEVEIPITEKIQNDLEGRLKNNKDRDKVIKDYVKEVKDTPEFKEELKKAGVKFDNSGNPSNISSVSSKGIISRIRNTNSVTRKTSDNFGTKETAATKGEDNFDTWFKNRDYVDRYLYGSDKVVQAYRNKLKLLNTTVPQSNGQQLSNASNNTPRKTPKRKYALTKEEIKELKSSLDRKNPNFSTNTLKVDEAASVKGFGDFYVMKTSNPDEVLLTIDLKDGTSLNKIFKKNSVKEETLNFLRTEFLKKKQRRVNPRTKLEIVRTLKNLGVMRRGGYIDKSVNLIISEFLSKLKR